MIVYISHNGHRHLRLYEQHHTQYLHMYQVRHILRRPLRFVFDIHRKYLSGDGAVHTVVDLHACTCAALLIQVLAYRSSLADLGLAVRKSGLGADYIYHL